VAEIPAAFVRDAVSLLAGLDCCAEITALERRADGSESKVAHVVHGPASSEWLEAEISGTEQSNYRLRARPWNSGLAKLDALFAFAVILSAAELAHLRLGQKERASLWPVEHDAEGSVGVFASPVMHELLAKLDQLAKSNVPVLITGETGVGKEIIARELHRRTFGPNAPFLPYNCKAVPADMLDAQLFGHKRGAFTGATENFPGVIRSAAGGTLLLDEIGELGMDIQPKLLRFLDSGEVHPIGEPRPVHVGVRIVAATNVDLERMVREGRFREDLYYRLNVVPLPVPALRERREEIPVLTEYYLDRYAQDMRRARLRVTDDALEYLLLYKWPGNVRQLANEIRRIVALAPAGAEIVPEMLSDEIRAARRTVDASQPAVGPNEIVVRIDQSLGGACAHLERVMIERALARHHGHLEQAAAALGISRKGLFLKRKRLGLAV
jgi:DNA-binding NtrC family response regulator